MTYPDGMPDQYPPQAAEAYGTYWPQSSSPGAQRVPPENRFAWLVLLFGLATYLVSFAPMPPGDSGWGVRFSALAAVVAALGLLPRQRAHTRLIAALAVMGFLEALSRCISAVGGQHVGWATIVIVVLNALQAVAAIAALLAQLRAVGAPARASTPYPTYGYYAQSAQQYYAANTQQPHRQPAQTQATAQAAAVAPAHTQRSTAERDALYAEYLKPQQPGPNPVPSSLHSGRGRHPAHPASGTGMPATGPADRIQPENGTASGGSSAQSS
jgi:hypothetical protein